MNATSLLAFAHWVMAFTLSFSLLIVYVAYGTDVMLTIRTQVLLHVGLIIFPALFKISYIVRLNALKQLGRAVD